MHNCRIVFQKDIEMVTSPICITYDCLVRLTVSILSVFMDFLVRCFILIVSYVELRPYGKDAVAYGRPIGYNLLKCYTEIDFTGLRR